MHPILGKADSGRKNQNWTLHWILETHRHMPRPRPIPAGSGGGGVMAIMSGGLHIIDLTDKQCEDLAVLDQMVTDALKAGARVAIIAQVHPQRPGGYMVCRFVTNEEMNKMYKAMGYDEGKEWK